MPTLFPVTYKCNLSCIYCKEKERPVDVEKGLDLICQNSDEWVYITGGEPMLVDNINDICDRLRAAGKKVGLTTNGTIHRFDVLGHVDRVGVSIDGDETLTDKNRGVGTYQKALAFLKEATKHCETVIMATIVERDPVQERHLEFIGEQLGVTYLQETLCT